MLNLSSKEKRGLLLLSAAFLGFVLAAILLASPPAEGQPRPGIPDTLRYTFWRMKTGITAVFIEDPSGNDMIAVRDLGAVGAIDVDRVRDPGDTTNFLDFNGAGTVSVNADGLVELQVAGTTEVQVQDDTIGFGTAATDNAEFLGTIEVDGSGSAWPRNYSAYLNGADRVGVVLHEVDGTANEKYWLIDAQGDTFSIRSASDDGSTFDSLLSATRSGTTISDVTIAAPFLFADAVTVQDAGSFKIGTNGTAYDFWAKSNAAINFGSTASLTCSSSNVTVTGCASSAHCTVNRTTAHDVVGDYSCYTGTNIVTVEYCNQTAAARDPASATFNVSCFY